MRLPSVNKQIEHIDFAGGLDLVTPKLGRKPGTLRACVNFECDINGGYTTVKGYEAFDGQKKPSSASYAILYASGIQTVTLGTTLTGAISSATGVIIAVTTTEFVLTMVSGTFEADENLTVSAVVKGVSLGAQRPMAALTSRLHAQYKNLAADAYRALIGAVPGSGPVRGVWEYLSTVYAFRDSSDGTEGTLYRSTSAGWEQITFFKELSFTDGRTTHPSGTIPVGTVVYGTNHGATATIKAVVVESGTLLDGDAAGRLIIDDQVGDFANDVLQIQHDPYYTVLTTVAESSDITLLPGGRYEFITANFKGAADSVRVYGVDGVNRGFEFDGNILIPINTGMDVDRPSHVAYHAGHLCFSFGPSFQHSSPGFPYEWEPLVGAGEIALGDNITQFMSLPGSSTTAALAVVSRNSMNILYGTGSASWSLVTYSSGFGGITGSIQTIGETLMLDDNGITSLRTSQAYGNFADATLSTRIQPMINSLRGQNVYSCVSRKKNQYRLLFQNGLGLYLTVLSGKVVGITPVSFPDRPTCVCSVETDGGDEAIYFGSTDGFVYQLDKGTSFNGAAITSIASFSYAHCGTPYVDKRWRRLILEIMGEGYSEFGFLYKLEGGSPELSQPSLKTVTVGRSPEAWDLFTWDDFTWGGIVSITDDEAGVSYDDTGYTWDEYVWDGLNLEPNDQPLEGFSTDIVMDFKVSGDYFDPITFTGAQIQYSQLRYKR